MVHLAEHNLPFRLRIVGMNRLVTGDQNVMVDAGLGYDNPIKWVACPRNLQSLFNDSMERFGTDCQPCPLDQIGHDRIHCGIDAADLVQILQLQPYYWGDSPLVTVHQILDRF